MSAAGSVDILRQLRANPLANPLSATSAVDRLRNMRALATAVAPIIPPAPGPSAPVSGMGSGYGIGPQGQRLDYTPTGFVQTGAPTQPAQYAPAAPPGNFVQYGGAGQAPPPRGLAAGGGAGPWPQLEVGPNREPYLQGVPEHLLRMAQLAQMLRLAKERGQMTQFQQKIDIETTAAERLAKFRAGLEKEEADAATKVAQDKATALATVQGDEAGATAEMQAYLADVNAAKEARAETEKTYQTGLAKQESEKKAAQLVQEKTEAAKITKWEGRKKARLTSLQRWADRTATQYSGGKEVKAEHADHTIYLQRMDIVATAETDELSDDLARQYAELAGGDIDKAEKWAKEDGFKWPQ